MIFLIVIIVVVIMNIAGKNGDKNKENAHPQKVRRQRLEKGAAK